MRCGEFRLASKPSIDWIVSYREGIEASVQMTGIQISASLAFPGLAQVMKNGLANLIHFFLLLFPYPCEVWQQVEHGGLGEISAGKERNFFGSHDHSHGPPATTGHHLRDRHIHMIEIGPLLPVHFYTDVILIEKMGDFLIFKGLPFHYMTPVAGGVSDGEKNWFIF